MIFVAREADADTVAEMIRRVIAVSNAGDYPAEMLARVAAGFTSDLIKDRIASTFVLVAKANDRLVGTGSLSQSYMRSLFVDPSFQGRGIGSALCDALEEEAMRRGQAGVDVQSSLTAQMFYTRRGYRLMSESVRDGESIIMMRKTLIFSPATPAP